VIAACGVKDRDSAENVLHLREYDATEEEFRTYVQLEFTPAACRQLEGLSPREVVNVANASDSGGESLWTQYGERVGLREVPGQRADEASMLRAAQIMLEVCERFDL
jgi:hypothetical protein